MPSTDFAVYHIWQDSTRVTTTPLSYSDMKQRLEELLPMTDADRLWVDRELLDYRAGCVSLGCAWSAITVKSAGTWYGNESGEDPEEI